MKLYLVPVKRIIELAKRLPAKAAKTGWTIPLVCQRIETTHTEALLGAVKRLDFVHQVNNMGWILTFFEHPDQGRYIAIQGMKTGQDSISNQGGIE